VQDVHQPTRHDDLGRLTGVSRAGGIADPAREIFPAAFTHRDTTVGRFPAARLVRPGGVVLADPGIQRVLQVTGRLEQLVGPGEELGPHRYITGPGPARTGR
jgi:hypothetical protein